MEEPYKREAATFDIPFLSSIAPIRWSRENYLLLDRQERTVSAGEAMAMAQEQLAALEERTFAGMEVLQREVSGQELPDRFRLEGVYLCVEDIGEEREILTGEKAGKLTVKAEEEQLVASGSILLTTYEIVFDKETMEVQEVRIPSLDGVVEISDFSFTD